MLEKVADVGQAKRGEGLSALGDVLGCSAEVAWPRGNGEKMGINELRWAVLQAVGLDCDENGRMRNLAFDLQPGLNEEVEPLDVRPRHMQAAS